MKKLAALFLFVLVLSTALVAAEGAAIGGATVDREGQDNRGRRGRGRGRDDSNSNSDRNRGDIAPPEARKAALEAIPGEIIKEEFERENGRQIYEFYIRRPDGIVFEVYVDAATLKVVKVERR
ncbi:MAG TPA: PepSY domain-containing protein [Pyrinomonadaceae bacterium]|nr:PepSY domain-containing protein [Pyrinomonadaceae bacterium]